MYTRCPVVPFCVNVFRYQPTPCHGSFPVLPEALGLNGPAIAQSCGKRTACHAESSKLNCLAASGCSPLVKRQSRLKSCTARCPKANTGTSAKTPNTMQHILLGRFIGLILPGRRS